MAKDPAFLFYPGDYLRDTQCLSELAQVAYDRIMCEHMRNISKDVSNIGITQDRLNFFIKRLNELEKSDIYHVLKKTGALFQIEWVAESICKRKTYSENRAENRKGKSKEHVKTYDSHMENEIVIEDENEIKDKNDTKIGGTGGRDLSLVSRMEVIWTTTFPKYTKQKVKDSHALKDIADFIFMDAGVVNGYGNPEQEQLALNTFQQIANEVKKETFWINKPLKSISSHIQEFYNKIKNPINGTTKSTGATKLDDDVLKQKLAERINQWKQASG